MYNYPQLLGQGFWREVKLSEGLELCIGDLSDRLASPLKEDTLVSSPKQLSGKIIEINYY
ncbi:hypothetical protein ACOWPH_15340 [Anabaena sp. PCC 7938]|uniref:Uncharacterized protein n=1 Tax=Anabaena cylindrica (strain ATCC 27899 / PCC 7122) TaxID=272123 RepID=K9ZM50_ANACC|nr:MULTISPECIES: hypothetical protein [Anabaena]AFZ59627.1 hypothetical protein Anacy_4263 [Anabaena cylindrica PCC 7122]MCM2406273.1 hypothetical protein [Anabaena sp. CCAP 1446/1C]BAY03327.1 hypothetical protein NIES19_25800 [Anabaena cylindrica PCC 7122]